MKSKTSDTHALCSLPPFWKKNFVCHLKKIIHHFEKNSSTILKKNHPLFWKKIIYHLKKNHPPFWKKIIHHFEKKFPFPGELTWCVFFFFAKPSNIICIFRCFITMNLFAIANTCSTQPYLCFRFPLSSHSLINIYFTHCWIYNLWVIEHWFQVARHILLLIRTSFCSVLIKHNFTKCYKENKFPY